MKDAHSAESNEKSKISDFYDIYFSSIEHVSYLDGHFSGEGGGRGERSAYS